MREATPSNTSLVVWVEAAERNMSARRHRAMIMSVEQHFSTHASQTGLSASHQISKSTLAFQLMLSLLNREIMKCHRFHVRALMMPVRVEGFALSRCFQNIALISL